MAALSNNDDLPDLSAASIAPPRTRRDDLIQKHADAFGIDPDLIRAIMGTESRGKPRAVSPKGAQGLMQLMPTTAANMGVTDPFDEDQNIMGGAKYLRQMLDRYKGDIPKTLASYNAGPGAVDKFKGIPPFAETQAYVRQIGGKYHGTGYAGLPDLSSVSITPDIPDESPVSVRPETTAHYQNTGQANILGGDLPDLSQVAIAQEPTNPSRLINRVGDPQTPVPEHPETLTAQAQSATRPDSPKLGLLVTPGATPPSIPSGFTMVDTPKGKLYFDPAKVKAAGITDPVAQMDRILGTVEPVTDTSQGNAVVARDPVTGRELEAKIVTTPETAQAQAKVNAQMHPDSVQSVEPAQSVVAGRSRWAYADPNWQSKLTKLSGIQEQQFQQWAKQNKVPLTDDYDMRGFWRGLKTHDPDAAQSVDPNDNKLHFPDKWKTPRHQSFSKESMYATSPNAPAWNDQDQLVANNGQVLFDDRDPNQVHREAGPDTVQSQAAQPSVVARRQQARKVPIRHIPTASERVEGFFRNAPMAPRQPNANMGRVGQTSPRTLSPEAGAAAGDVRALLAGGSEGLQQRRIAQRGPSPRAVSTTGRSGTISNTDAQALGLPRQQEPVELGRGVEYNKPAHQIASEKAARQEHDQFIQTLTPKEQASIDADVNELVNSTRVGGGLKAGLSGSIARTDLTAAGIMDWLNLGGKPGESDPLSARRQGQIRLEVLRRAADKLPESTLRGLAELAGGTPLDILRLAALSKLPGGAVTGFGIDSAAQAAGEGRPAREVVARGAQGALTGGVFHGAGGKSLIPRLATIGAGTAAVDTAFNGGPDPKSILTNMLFGAIPGGKGEARPGEPVVRENRITERTGKEDLQVAPEVKMSDANIAGRIGQLERMNPARRTERQKGELETLQNEAARRQSVANPAPEKPVLTEQIPANDKNVPNLSRGVSMDEVRRANPAPEPPVAVPVRESAPTVAPQPVEAAQPKPAPETVPVASTTEQSSSVQPERVTPKLVEPEPTKTAEPDARFAANKIFTADKVAEARARIAAKAKGNQLNVGLDPELAKDYAIVGAAHIEAGARQFRAWAGKMVEDFGEEIKPHLTAIYAKARDAHDYEQFPESAALPDVGKSKIGRSVEAKTIEKGLTQSFEGTAEYNKKTVAGEAEKVANLLNSDPEQVRRIIRGEEPVPNDVSGTYLIKGAEDAAQARGDVEALREIARSPLTSETSRHAQELRMAAERSPDSAALRIKELRDARREAAKAKNVEPVEKRVEAEVKTIKKHVVRKTANPRNWESFIREIAC